MDEKGTVYWDIYDYEKNELLEKGRIIDKKLEPDVGEEIVGVGRWKRAVVEKFNKDKPRNGLPVYAVYVSRRL